MCHHSNLIQLDDCLFVAASSDCSPNWLHHDRYDDDSVFDFTQPILLLLSTPPPHLSGLLLPRLKLPPPSSCSSPRCRLPEVRWTGLTPDLQLWKV